MPGSTSRWITLRALLGGAAIAVAVVGGISFAAAQNTAQPEPANPQPPPPNQSKKDSVPPATDKSEETRAGTTEPSSKIQGTKATTSVFVNGVLDVPGAATDVDSVPAKFSARTAADDALPMAGYTLRHLTDKQRGAVFASVRNKQASQAKLGSADSYSVVGAQVPTPVALDGLSLLPEDVIARHPEMKDVMVTNSGEKVILVNPRTRMVIGVLGP
jgi:hypothetical protein